MREILFRGMRTKNGEWVYGFYCQKPCPCTEDGNPITHYIADLPPFGTEVDPDTVGQFTGLTDGHGKRIFEGDILLYCGVQNVVVSFENGQFVINHYAINLLKARNAESEVIGNIHDNPELLEVEE